MICGMLVMNGIFRWWMCWTFPGGRASLTIRVKVVQIMINGAVGEGFQILLAKTKKTIWNILTLCVLNHLWFQFCRLAYPAFTWRLFRSDRKLPQKQKSCAA